MSGKFIVKKSVVVTTSPASDQYNPQIKKEWRSAVILGFVSNEEALTEVPLEKQGTDFKNWQRCQCSWDLKCHG